MFQRRGTTGNLAIKFRDDARGSVDLVDGVTYWPW